ncbi:MAG: ROK family protein [Alphaproteobacteria bacterium]|jgi:glucokinase|nr:ROK family protein [Alphaproteobacteria bacterium]MDP6817760.1 ROK family protein [Alphaproteobacteria bacterium]|tara:strand:- start:1742 stop:2644 length:903 start_codon:yes stop_codon:yes gene_type:complete
MKGVIGIDVGGTKIAFGAVSPAGEIVLRRTIATHPDDSFDEGIARLSAGIEALLAETGWGAGDIGGIGIGCPGPVDTERGVILSVYTLPGWSNREFAAPMSERFGGTPVRLENDANAALLGEALAGAARGKRSAVMLTLGTGIGGAVLLDGKIHVGANGAHPELGHVPALAEGPECPCGLRGCYEVIASGPAIAEAGEAVGLDGSEAVFAAAAKGHAGAQAIIDNVAKATEAAIWTILHTFLPEIILFGGGIADGHWPLFEAAAQKSLAAATLARDQGVTIARAKLGNDAGIVGAANLVM